MNLTSALWPLDLDFVTFILQYKKYRRHNPYFAVLIRFVLLAKILLFCMVMLLICVLMYIPVYKKLPNDNTIVGWTVNTNRNTGIYIKPNIFTIIHDPDDVCPKSAKKTLFLLIVVCSSTTNFENRTAVRKTWGDYENYITMSKLFRKVQRRYKNYNYWHYPILTNLSVLLKFPEDLRNNNKKNGYAKSMVKNHNPIPPKHPMFKLVFLLGLPSENNDTVLQGKIEEEIEQYGDIIQEGFVDSYNNLTLKSIMMLKWVVHHCNDSSVRYILKTDDDMFINIPNLVTTLKNKSKEFDKIRKSERDKEYLLIGDLIIGAVPASNSTNKWYSPRYMYRGSVYPRYLSGTGYVMSLHTAKALYYAALRTPYFHLEDIYITGMSAKLASPRQKAHDNADFFRTPRKILDACFIYRHVTIHEVTPSAMVALLDNLTDYRTVETCEKIRLTQIKKDRLPNY